MGEEINVNRGSEWRKWDLHVHTPGTSMNDGFDGTDDEDKWDKWLEKIERNDASVLGITDYFSIGNYFKALEKKQAGRMQNVNILLPNVELRMLPSTSDGRCINIHCIFDPVIAHELENRFFQELTFEYQSKPYKATHSDLIALGRAYSNDSRLDHSSAYKKGVEQFKVDFTTLKAIFKNDPSLRESTIIVVSNSNNDGNSGIQHHALAATREEIYRFSDAIFSGNPNDNKYFLGFGADSKEEVLRKYASLKPCLHGSDAHSLEKLLTPDQDRFCWIKSDTTFEGLKQIIYEPSDRVRIQPNKPIAPIRKISEVQLNFESDTIIQLQGRPNSQVFCFSGVSKKIYLSDYFTCFIGGRGTGKSTLLNLIYKSFDNSARTEFFKKNSISHEDQEVDINSVIQIEGTAETVEFLEQNHIENFAMDRVGFTKAIYNRLKSKEPRIEDLETELKKSIGIFDEQVSRLIKHDYLSYEIRELKKNFSAAKKIIDTVGTEEYKSITDSIEKLNAEYFALKKDREKLTNLEENIEEFLDVHSIHEGENPSKYSLQYNEILSKIQKVLDELRAFDFNAEKKKEDSLLKQVKIEQSKLEDYLKKQGLTEENLQDVTSASGKAENYKIQIIEKKAELESINKQITEFDETQVNEPKKQYEEGVKKTIEELKKILDEVNAMNSADVDKIDLKFEFNEELALDQLFQEFREVFSDYEEGLTLRDVPLRQCLFSITPMEILEETKGYSDLKKKVAGENNYNVYLDAIFQSESSFEIYKLLIKKHLLNSAEYLKIEVFYRSKPMEQASFGQKCTAVIVIMLLFGHNPIIIDEPEAHLDSSLIANYLVDLIKKEKINRQIIFATHNANFVINADAEQIHILEMPENQTNFIQTTIENLEHRDKLLKLEGGKEAFERRKNKYHC